VVFGFTVYKGLGMRMVHILVRFVPVPSGVLN
jgi:hypothetical protein